MEIFQLDERACLFLSPAVDEWEIIEQHGITVVIDLEGDLDCGVPTMLDHTLYLYFPIHDDDLPDLHKLHAVARLGASLVESGHKVLSHCGMGFNRSALVAGLILTYLGLSGAQAVELLRERRPGALFNEKFAEYLSTINASDEI